MKGKRIKLVLSDGSKVGAVVLYVNGNTFTVKATDGYIYEVPSDNSDDSGVYYAS